MKHWSTFVLIGFIILFSLLHVAKLNVIPPGLSNDEANIGYEAWSIATTGKDQWGNRWPLTFEGFGNWSLPVYIYSLVPFIAIFGPTVTAVRLLSWLSLLVMVGMAFLIMRQLGWSVRSGLLASSFVSITPWIFGLTRTASEVVLATALFMISMFFLLLARRHPFSLVGSAAALSLSMLTYYGMWIFAPLAIGFTALAMRKAIRASRTTLIVSVSTVVVAVVVMLFISSLQRGNARFRQVSFFGDPALIATLNELKGACEQTYSGSGCRALLNRMFLYVGQYTGNFLSHFSIRDLFVTNSSQGILPPGGLFFMVQAPLFFLGLWNILQGNRTTVRAVFLPWLFWSAAADSLTGPGNFARYFMVAPAVAMLSGHGLSTLTKTASILLGGLVIASVVRFLVVYATYFPRVHSLYTHYEYLPLVEMLRKTPGDMPIYLSSRFRDTKQYIFFLFYQRIPPAEFQTDGSIVRERDEDGWIWVKQVRQWRFVKLLPGVEELPRQAVLVGAAREEIEPFVKLYRECRGLQIVPEGVIQFLNGDLAFSIVRVEKAERVTCPLPLSP